MNRVLAFTEFVCGDAATKRVFEPLLADWQRELQSHTSVASYVAVFMSGSFAFLRALATCAVLDGVWAPPLRATLASLAAVVAAISVSIGVLLIAPLPQNVPRSLAEPMVQWWILAWAGILVPPVFMLATYLLRRDVSTTFRHAIVFTLLAVAVTGLVVVSTTDDALRRRYDTFEVQERMRELALARHRAGYIVYTGDTYQREMRTTMAERREKFERYREEMAAHRNEPPVTWRYRVTQLRPVMLAVIFAAMGWSLAGFSRPTATKGFGWWALMFAATATLTRIFWLVVGVPMPRTPEWLMPALFILVAGMLVAHTWRQRHAAHTR